MTDDVWREFLDSSAPQYMNEVFTATPEQVERGALDPATLTQSDDMEWRAEDGPRRLPMPKRGYARSELALVCRTAGFEVEHVWGGTAGDWGRRSVELVEVEIMVVLRRPAT
jgi:hypothetical protein